MKIWYLNVNPWLLVLLFCLFPTPSVADDTVRARQQTSIPTNTSRPAVFISDLHFGVGKLSDGRWDPTEDFRWSSALASFLKAISSWGHDALDLVIAGDLLELWQPPPGFTCVSTDSDLGCTPEEYEAIVRTVIKAHEQDLSELGEFARKGTNRLFIIPGNHDAAMLLPNVWKLVVQAMKVKQKDRIFLVESGVWVSENGQIIAEHGHDIGGDVNKFPNWPAITTLGIDGTVHVLRSWGERFVQELFNARERMFSVIDNFIPETAGVRFYLSQWGVTGKIADVARFLRFNLMETSIAKKVQALGSPSVVKHNPKWDVARGRNLGYKLFAGALPLDDPFRDQMLSPHADDSWLQLRQELDSLAKDPQKLPDSEVVALCDQLAIRVTAHETSNELTCGQEVLGAALKATLISRDSILRSHLNDRLLKYPEMKLFVYGHTHVMEFDWQLDLIAERRVKIFNTGAFQRLIDSEQFQMKAQKKGLTLAQALERFQLEEDFPACYPAVLVDYEAGHLEAHAKNWHVGEDGKGQFVSPCDGRCAQLGRTWCEK